MTLIGILILLPTPSLHPGGPDAAIPGGDVDRAPSRPLFAVVRSVSFPSDPTGIGECADGAWDDDEGAGSLLDVPVLPRSVPEGQPAVPPMLVAADLLALRSIAPAPLLRPPARPFGVVQPSAARGTPQTTMAVAT